MENNEAKRKRPRGSGSIFKQLGSRFWWIAYYHNGRVVRESSHSEKLTDAQNLLKKRSGEAESGNLIAPKVQRVTVAELFDAVLVDYRNNGKTIEWAERVWKLHLEPFFGYFRAANVGTDALASYVSKRKDEKAANGTINRELALLRRAFSLGYTSTPRKVSAPLNLSGRMLAESKPRSGFVDEKQYRVLADKAAGQLWLRAMLALGYVYGFRKAELLSMRVSQVDLLARTVRLNPGETKNDEGRTVALTEECYQLVSQLVRGKHSDDFLFTRVNGGPVRDFRGSWDVLTEATKMSGLLFHDLRRSAVRNMVRRGVTERVAMRISGHKSRSVFDRYNIVSESDLADAALKVERGGKAELARASDIHSSYIEPAKNEVDSGKESVRKPS
jgi:integrase